MQSYIFSRCLSYISSLLISANGRGIGTASLYDSLNRSGHQKPILATIFLYKKLAKTNQLPAGGKHLNWTYKFSNFVKDRC